MTSLKELDACFQGIIPGYFATMSGDGEPNVTCVSVVRLLGPTRVGISCQFMNKSVKNIEATRRAQLMLLCPNTLREFRLDLAFIGTISQGPIFDRVDAQISAVAAQSGMEDVFRLESVLQFEVTDWRPVSGTRQADTQMDQVDALELLDRVGQAIQSAPDLEALLDATFAAVDRHLGLRHGFFLLAEQDGTRLYNLASHGFDTPRFGAEIALGEGLYGKCAERRQPVRVGSFSRERLMSRAVARESGKDGPGQLPLPGLTDVESGLAIPVCEGDSCLGVLCFQSSHPGAFTEEHERMMSIVARHLAAMMGRVGVVERSALEVSGRRGPLGSRALVTRVKFFESDGSVFLDDHYVIKGTSGRILWSVLFTYAKDSREEFSNKEFRLDQAIGLPAIKDNLEARLIALRKRLDERALGIRIDKTGRGRFRLEVERELVLEARE